jgi:Domain of unknown function DUF1828
MTTSGHEAEGRPTDERITCLRLQRVLHDFGNSLHVVAIDDGAFLVSSPFRLPSGEMFPIVIEPQPTGWRLTDRGETAAHLDLADLSAADVQQLKLDVQSDGLELSDTLVLSAEFDDLPTPSDLANLVQAQARIGGLPHHAAAS